MLFSLRSLGGALVVLIVALAVRSMMFTLPLQAGFDEVKYAQFAEILREQGVQGLRDLAARYGTDPELSVAPLPYRIGYIALGAATGAIAGVDGVQPLAWVALFASALLVVAAFLLAQDWLGPRVAWMCVPLLLASPLAIHLGRRALQDSLMALCLILTVWLAHRVWTRGGKSAAVGLCIAALAGFLVKESMLFLYPSLLLAAIFYWVKGYRNLRAGFFALLAAPILYFGIMVWVAGGVESFFHTYLSYSSMQFLIPYAVMYQKGPWFRYFIDLMLISPWVFILGMALVARGSERMRAWKNDEPWQPAHGFQLLGIYLLSGLVIFGNLPILNARLVLHLDTLLRIGLVAGVVAATMFMAGRQPLFELRRTVLAIAIVVVLTVLDFMQASRLFGRTGMYDPITVQLIKYMGFANAAPKPPAEVGNREGAE